VAAVNVIGDALLDVQVAPSGPPRAGGDVPAAVRLGPGGQGANLAVRLARRGIDVRLACVIGDDPAGSIVRDAMVDESVTLLGAPVAGTGSVVVILDATGERTMLSDRVPLASRLDPAALPPADWLLVSGYLLLEADASRLVGGLARVGSRRMLVGCSLDGSDVDGWAARATALRPDLLVLNADEAAALAGTAAEVARRIGVPVVVVTDPSGAHAVVAGTATVTVAASQADGPVLDTTGAGDAFAAALLAHLVRSGWPPAARTVKVALAAAAVAGVATTRVAGAQGRIRGEGGAG
jgi:sugar/nucleoside kinase (ribokinase family)